jgi:hypothetical protein
MSSSDLGVTVFIEYMKKKFRTIRWGEIPTYFFIDRKTLSRGSYKNLHRSCQETEENNMRSARPKERELQTAKKEKRSSTLQVTP